jgi:hypothetical protein
MTLARRVEIDPHDEPEHDAWSEAWGDRALQALGRRLMSYGLDGEQAMLVVEQTWLFYSDLALPELHKRFPMGIASKQSENRPAVYLYLTFSTPEGSLGPDLGSETFHGVQERFANNVAAPLSDIVTMHLEPFPPSQTWLAYRALQELAGFEVMLRFYTAGRNLDYVGVFVDNLEAELKMVMDPESVPLWLGTPNLMFGGRKPAELFDDPRDRQLRGVITRAKFNLPAS